MGAEKANGRIAVGVAVTKRGERGGVETRKSNTTHASKIIGGKKLGLGSWFDWVAGILILSSIGVGLTGLSTNFGSVSSMVEQMVSKPASFGVGLVVFYVGFDTWVPCVPQSFLDRYFLGWMTFFYPFAGGFVPHYSLWSLFFALIWTVIGTWVIMHGFSLDFFWKGFGVGVVMFFVGWYVWTLIAWGLMYWGASMMGLSGQELHSLWTGTVTAQESDILQYMFIVTAIVSAIWGGKKLGGAVL